MQALIAVICQISAGLLTNELLSFCASQTISVGFWFVQPLLAAVFSRLLAQPIWWSLIHLAFFPLVVLFFAWSLPAWFYLIAFCLLLLVFWGVVKGDVPLFLSSSSAVAAMIGVLERERAESFIDLGAGIGSIAIPLAKRFPELKITAVERAPIPYWILSWRCRKVRNIEVRRGSFWAFHLANYDVVYVFLSPSVMPRLGEKCRSEINGKPNLLVSLSFPLSEKIAETVIESAGRAGSTLYCYRFD